MPSRRSQGIASERSATSFEDIGTAAAVRGRDSLSGRTARGCRSGTRRCPLCSAHPSGDDATRGRPSVGYPERFTSRPRYASRRPFSVK